MRRSALVLTALCCLGPLAATGHAASKATSVASFKEVSGINAEFRAQGNAIFRETTGRLHMHVILSVAKPVENASIEIAAGRCGQAAGRSQFIDIATIPGEGANVTADVDTHLTTLGLPHAHSVRIVADGTEITCAKPVSLVGGHGKPTVTVSDLKPVGSGGLYGITITRQGRDGAKGRHWDVLTINSPKDVASGVRAAPRARAAFAYQRIEWVMLNQQGMTIASWKAQPQAATETQPAYGEIPNSYKPSQARKLEVKGDGGVIAKAPAQRYRVAG